MIAPLRVKMFCFEFDRHTPVDEMENDVNAFLSTVPVHTIEWHQSSSHTSVAKHCITCIVTYRENGP